MNIENPNRFNKWMIALTIVILPITSLGNSLKDSLELVLQNIEEGTEKYLNVRSDLNYQLLVSSDSTTKASMEEVLSLAEQYNSDYELIRAYRNLGLYYYYRESDFDKSLSFHEKAHELSIKIRNVRSRALDHLNSSMCYTQLGEISIAISNLKEGLLLVEGDTSLEHIQAILLNNLAAVYATSSPIESIEFKFKALTIAEKNKDFNGITLLNTNISSAYLSLEEYDKGVFYAQKALNIFNSKQFVHKEIEGRALNLLANNFLKLNNIDSALHYYNIAIDHNTINQNSELLTEDYIGIGRILILQDQKKEGVEFLEKALELSEKDNNIRVMKSALYQLSNYHYKHLNLEKALSYINRGIDIAYKLKDYSHLAKANLLQHNIYLKKQDFKKALASFKIHSQFNDSTAFDLKSKELGLLEADFNFRHERQKKAQELQIQKTQYDTKIKLQKQQTKWVAIVLLLFVLISIMLFFIYKNMRKRKNELSLINTKLTISNNKVNEQKKKLEILINELEESNENLKNFTHIIAHDIEAPIRTISSFAQILEHKYKDIVVAEDKTLFDYLIKGCKNISEMIKNLLTFSTLTKNLPQSESLNIKNVISEVQDDLSVLIDEQNNALNIQLQSDLPNITAHHSLMYQLFLNLISNSIKYSKTDGPINVQLAYKMLPDENVEICFSDNGIGIPLKQQKEIFKPFVRLHNNKDIEGNGIGLATCKKIIEFYNGKIWVESDQMGTKFYFTLPR